MEKKITSKKEFVAAIQREKERRKRANEAEQKKLAALEIQKKKEMAAERFKKMGGGVPNLRG
jgi:hypothetical protein